MVLCSSTAMGQSGGSVCSDRISPRIARWSAVSVVEPDGDHADAVDAAVSRMSSMMALMATLQSNDGWCDTWPPQAHKHEFDAGREGLID